MVPHPRFRERRFVLEPLAEIAPDLRDPVSGTERRGPAGEDRARPTIGAAFRGSGRGDAESACGMRVRSESREQLVHRLIDLGLQPRASPR